MKLQRCSAGWPTASILFVLLLSILTTRRTAHAWFIARPPLSVTTRTPTSTAVFHSNLDPSSLLYAEHEKLLVTRGEFEADLLPPGQELEANIVKGGGGAGGFGSTNANKGKSKRSLLQAQAKFHAQVLKEQGVVRIDKVLNPKLADQLRQEIYAARQQAEASNNNSVFADVLLTHNRRDMTLSLEEKWALKGLSAILLESAVGHTLAEVLGQDAILREWSCLMSDPGSQRQVMHPDTPWQEQPVLFTCFVALQDVTLDMGPTTWLPQTHTESCHEQFQDESTKDELLKSSQVVMGTLKKGSCAIFDSRLLHCGGANVHPDQSRAIMYCSFQNPRIINPGNPGSIRKEYIGNYTLQQLMETL